MHILVVIDHPNPNSFSHAAADQFAMGARSVGHTVELADLNVEGFNPTWTQADIDNIETPDLTTERARIARADAICLVFPLFWWGMPAMMKGWIDRVWGWGWAYDQLDDLEGSLQKSRPGVLLVPAGASSDEIDTQGYRAAMETAWIKGTFGFFGFSPRKLELLCGTQGSAKRRAGLLARSYEIGAQLVQSS